MPKQLYDARAVRRQARGAWVAVAHDGRTVVATGDDPAAVLAEAREKGADDALLLATSSLDGPFIG